MATAPPFDAESALIGCVVCGYAEGTEPLPFSCGCHLPIHIPCISDWKQDGTICPFCERVWNAPPAQAMRRDRCHSMGVCAALTILFLIVVAFGVSLFLYFKHLA